MTICSRSLVRLSIVLAAAAAWGCEHDPELERVGGGPLPELDGDAKLCPPFDPAIVTPAYPCEIEVIVVAKCQRCHSDPPREFVPFKLTTWEDTQVDYAGKPVHERMYSAVSLGVMPYMLFNLDPPVEPLTDDEKSTLLAWLADCAPPAEKTTCP